MGRQSKPRVNQTRAFAQAADATPEEFDALLRTPYFADNPKAATAARALNYLATCTRKNSGSRAFRSGLDVVHRFCDTFGLPRTERFRSLYSVASVFDPAVQCFFGRVLEYAQTPSGVAFLPPVAKITPLDDGSVAAGHAKLMEVLRSIQLPYEGVVYIYMPGMSPPSEVEAGTIALMMGVATISYARSGATFLGPCVATAHDVCMMLCRMRHQIADCRCCVLFVRNANRGTPDPVYDTIQTDLKRWVPELPFIGFATNGQTVPVARMAEARERILGQHLQLQKPHDAAVVAPTPVRPQIGGGMVSYGALPPLPANMRASILKAGRKRSGSGQKRRRRSLVDDEAEEDDEDNEYEFREDDEEEEEIGESTNNPDDDNENSEDFEKHSSDDDILNDGDDLGVDTTLDDLDRAEEILEQTIEKPKKRRKAAKRRRVTFEDTVEVEDGDSAPEFIDGPRNSDAMRSSTPFADLMVTQRHDGSTVPGVSDTTLPHMLLTGAAS